MCIDVHVGVRAMRSLVVLALRHVAGFEMLTNWGTLLWFGCCSGCGPMTFGCGGLLRFFSFVLNGGFARACDDVIGIHARFGLHLLDVWTCCYGDFCFSPLRVASFLSPSLCLSLLLFFLCLFVSFRDAVAFWYVIFCFRRAFACGIGHTSWLGRQRICCSAASFLLRTVALCPVHSGVFDCSCTGLLVLLRIWVL